MASPYAPWLLLQGLTMVVSLLHTVFDMLAFKNDIGFWKNNKVNGSPSCRHVLPAWNKAFAVLSAYSAAALQQLVFGPRQENFGTLPS